MGLVGVTGPDGGVIWFLVSGVMILIMQIGNSS
jgi:hypothetical protein